MLDRLVKSYTFYMALNRYVGILLYLVEANEYHEPVYLLLGITHPFHNLQDNSFKQFLFTTSNISKTIISRKIKYESSSPICNYIFFILAFFNAPPDSNWLNSKLVPIKQVKTPNKLCSSKFARIKKVWFRQLAKKLIYTSYCTIPR